MPVVVVGPSKREAGLVVPAIFTANTKELRIATVFPLKKSQSDQRYVLILTW